MAGQLHDLHQPPVGREACKRQAGCRELLPVVIVELVAVAVALVNMLPAIGRRRPAALHQLTGPAAKAHGAALVRDIHLIRHQVDDRIGGPGVQLAGVSPRKARHIPGKPHHCHLHPQADAQEGHLVLPGVPDGADLALHAPAAKASGHQDAVAAAKDFGGIFICDRLAVHPADLHMYAVFNAPVGQGFRHGEICVVKSHILAHQGDGDGAGCGLGPVDHGGPLREIRHVADQAQTPHHHVRKACPFQHQGHFIEDGGRKVGDGVFRRDVAEQRDLVQHIPGDLPVAAAEDHIRLDAQAQKLLGGVLGGLALELPGAGDRDNEGDVDEHDVLPSPLRGHLPDGFQERLGLDIAYRAADLHDSHVGAGGVQGVDPPLDLPGDVGDDLHRAPQKVAPPLLAQDLPVDLAGGYGGVSVQIFVNEPLIVAQIQIRLRPVVGDEHLPVLIGAHGPRVHVQVGVQLLDLHLQPPLLEQASQRRRRDALAQAGDHASGDKNVLDCHHFLPASYALPGPFPGLSIPAGPPRPYAGRPRVFRRRCRRRKEKTYFGILHFLSGEVKRFPVQLPPKMCKNFRQLVTEL